MIPRWLLKFTVIGAMLVSLSSDAAPGPKKPRPRSKDGSYTLTVAGAVKGNGNGTVTGNELKIDADVVTEGGAKGTMTATLKLSNNHFDGPGTVMGQPATFKGRVDQPPADTTERELKGVRLTCTFKTASGEYGRVIGNLPAPAPRATTGSSDDGNGGRGRGRGRSGDD
ncbi:MAG: hypothetical protein ACAI43_09640 [Phycisphaerae bacterium]|nr:hypothetical protein [Tepidisphaeraceae bacterium]